MAAIVLGNEINIHENAWERSPLLNEKEKPFLEKVLRPLACHLCPAEMWVHCSNLAAPMRKAHWGGGSRQVLADICGHSDQPATVNLQPYLYREKPTSVSASVGGLSVICN